MIAVLASLAQTGGTTGSQLVPQSPTPISAPTKLVTPSIDWPALLPVIILALGGLLLLTITSLLRKRMPAGSYALYTVVVAGAAMVSAIPLWARVQGWDQLGWVTLQPSQPGAFTTAGGAIGIDGFSLMLTMVICASVILTSLFADGFLRREDAEGPELYVLLLLSATGGVIMAVANDLIVLFLGLETLSIAVYVLAAMNLRRSQSQEAGMKYFVLGSFSSAFFLYGIAFLYGATGSTNLISIKDFMSGTVPIKNGLLMVGLAFLLVGLAFKVAAVPFHSWNPDVYDGAPTPTVAYMASGVKAAAFAGIVRVFMVTFSNYSGDWQPIVYVLAVLSLFGGAALAIVQKNVKRMLAYSSISHAGFILVAVEAASERGVQALLFYLVAYTFMVAGSFGVATVVARRGDARHTLGDYRGLGASNPALALTFTVLLLAQAGIPFTSGFFAKFYAITAAVDAGSYWLALAGMVASVIAAFLYLRIIMAMYMSGDEHGEEPVPAKVAVPFATRLGLALCLVVTIGVGIFPSVVLDPARDARPALVQSTDTAQAQTSPLSLGGSTGP